MKTAKKIFCLVLAVMMIATMAVSAFADTAPTGKITITNAEAGKTYTIYKVFNATYSTYTDDEGQTQKTVAYTVSDPDVIAAIQEGCKTEYTQAGDCPFKLVGDGSEGFYYVEHRNLSNIEAGRGWIKTNLIDTGLVSATASQTLQTGNTVVFDVPYGYYLMTPGEGAIATVNTNTPSVSIVDKNPRSPSEPDKTADKKTVVVGDTVTYTASFKATNFYTESASYTKIIEEYNVKDTSKGLTDKTLVSAKWYTKKNDDGTFGGNSGNIANVTSAVDEDDANVTNINIPWVKNGASLYPSPVYVVLTYTAKVTDDIFSVPTSLTADNKIKVTYEYDNKTGEIPGEPEVKIPTIGLSFRKVDAQDDSVILEGAEFRLYKLEGNTPKYYAIDDEDVYEAATTIVVSKTMKNSDPVNYEDLLLIVKNTVPGFDSEAENKWFSIEDETDDYKIVIFGEETAAADTLSALDTDYNVTSSEFDEKAILVSEGTKVVSWVTDKADAKVLIADNQYGTLEVEGLAPGAYKLEETKAPEGYVPPSEPFDITVAATDGVYTVTFEGAEVSPQQTNPQYYTIIIANGTGSALPSTGGAGTVAIIAAGAVLFMAAAIVLVAKKRMYNEQ